jgi:hypothetical protein
MAKRTYTWDGSAWQGLASPAVSLDNYPNMTTTPISGFRNALINGGMDVWQRGTSGIVPTSTQPYSADRWESYRAGYAAGMSVYRPAGPTGITYAARVQRDVGNTSTAFMAFGQAIESVNSTRFDGKNATLSFWARAGANFSSASSILNAKINYGTGTDQNYRSNFTGNTVVASGDVTLTTSWQRFTITGNVNAAATQLGVQFSYTPVGTAGAADHFEITGVQLEEGSIATPFEQRPVGTELALCQRYYEVDTTFYGLVMSCYDSSAAYACITYLVPKRRIPDISIVNGSNASGWSAYGGGGIKTITSLLVNFTWQTSWQLRVLGSFSAGQTIHLDSAPSGNTFLYNAEL